MACECEQTVQSLHSPGLIDDDEDVVYCLIDPDLFDRHTSALKKKAFSKTELLNTALSVVRQRYSSGGEVSEKVIGPQVTRNHLRQFCGVFVCESRLIRAIGGDAKREICVADAGLEGFASHAHLGFSDGVAGKSKSVWEAARSNLVSAFQERGIQSLEAIFEE